MHKHLILASAIALALPRAVLAADGAAATNAADRLLSTVTSDRLEFDYRELVAFFDGNVRIDDPQLTLSAGKLLLYFTTNAVAKADAPSDGRPGAKVDVLKLVAIGGVNATVEIRNREGKYEKSTLTCTKATYTRDNNSLVLEGRPEVKHGSQGAIKGNRITLWLDDRNHVEYVEAEGSVHLEGVVPEKARGKNDKPAEAPETKPEEKAEANAEENPESKAEDSQKSEPEKKAEAKPEDTPESKPPTPAPRPQR